MSKTKNETLSFLVRELKPMGIEAVFLSLKNLFLLHICERKQRLRHVCLSVSLHVYSLKTSSQSEVNLKGWSPMILNSAVSVSFRNISSLPGYK